MSSETVSSGSSNSSRKRILDDSGSDKAQDISGVSVNKKLKTQNQQNMGECLDLADAKLISQGAEAVLTLIPINDILSPLYIYTMSHVFITSCLFVICRNCIILHFLDGRQR